MNVVSKNMWKVEISIYQESISYWDKNNFLKLMWDTTAPQ